MASADVVAVIPARGGSTRVPRKNVKIFNGKPIIEWPIGSARASGLVSRVVVSTDDAEISDVARHAGAEVPFERPSELATHNAGTAPVIQHAIRELGLASDAVVICLYPTATVTSAMIDEALGLSRAHPDHFVVSVGRHRSPVERSLMSSDDGLMALAERANLFTRTQDLPQRYFDAGKIYAATASVWLSHETMMDSVFVPLHLPEWATVDIDEPEDWPIAEALHRVFVLESL